MDVSDETLLTKEFVFFLSPRYFRLIFPEHKPKTKNGDLVSALGELKRNKILTPDSNWDKIKLTKKGSQYKKIVKKFMDLEALYNEDSDGLLDYRSELGRRAVIELIRFLSVKFDFNEYFRYLNLAVFETNKKEDWLEFFGEDFDLNTDESRLQLTEFLQKQKRNTKKFNTITKKITGKSHIKLDLSLIKRYLKKAGLKRPSPLLNHFNNSLPKVFEIEEGNFYVNLAELIKIKNAFEEYLVDFRRDENAWLSDYFELLRLPTKLFGFHKSEFDFTSKQIDTFLNLAIEAPKFFATQFSSIRDIGELTLIIFPINPKESFVIYSAPGDIIYYFSIPTDELSFTFSMDLVSYDSFPEYYRSSKKRFGKLFSWSSTITDVSKDFILDNIEDKDEKKLKEEELKISRVELKEEMKTLSHYSVSLFTICDAIVQKLTPSFYMNKCFCIFKNGTVSVDLLTTETLLTTIKSAKIEYCSELKKILKKIDNSISEILDIEEV